jgi:hypothetical protein
MVKKYEGMRNHKNIDENMESNSDIINKIKKVLAYTSNTNANEACNAMLLAQKMMIENNLSISDIVISEIKTKEVVNETVLVTRRSSWWHSSLANIISDNFKCGVYINRNRRDGLTNIKYVGLKEDVVLAKCVYLYAIEVITQKSIKHMQDVYMKSTYYGTIKGAKNEYIFGFLEGLKAKYAEQVKQNNWGLVIVKDPVVDGVIKNLHLKKGGKRTVITNGNDRDKSAGYTDGKSFQFVSGKLE